MNVTQEEARRGLIEIEKLRARTRKSLASTASPFLILWGIIWFIAFSSTQFLPLDLRLVEIVLRKCVIKIDWIWLVLNIIGFIGTWILIVRMPVKDVEDKRIFWLWLLLFIYAGIWLALLRPWDYLQLCAFIATIPMFAYVVMGLWAKDFLLWLGLIITALILAGYLWFQPIFWLWMALFGGGTLLGTGIYIRKAWR